MPDPWVGLEYQDEHGIYHVCLQGLFNQQVPPHATIDAVFRAGELRQLGYAGDEKSRECQEWLQHARTFAADRERLWRARTWRCIHQSERSDVPHICATKPEGGGPCCCGGWFIEGT